MKPYTRFVCRIPGAVLEVKKDRGVTIIIGNGQLFIESVQLEKEQEVCAADILNKLSYRLGRKHMF